DDDDDDNDEEEELAKDEEEGKETGKGGDEVRESKGKSEEEEEETSKAPIPPPTIPSIILENLSTFNSAFRFEERLRTSYAIAVDLSEMELKKILIEKMEGNKSIQQSDE
nr:hypothetical protein [Tanacetum cinerariifolium]